MSGERGDCNNFGLPELPVGPIFELHGASKKWSFPRGLKFLIEEMTYAVFENNPEDIYYFLAEFIKDKIYLREKSKEIQEQLSKFNCQKNNESFLKTTFEMAGKEAAKKISHLENFNADRNNYTEDNVPQGNSQNSGLEEQRKGILENFAKNEFEFASSIANIIQENKNSDNDLIKSVQNFVKEIFSTVANQSNFKQIGLDIDQLIAADSEFAKLLQQFVDYSIEEGVKLSKTKQFEKYKSEIENESFLKDRRISYKEANDKAKIIQAFYKKYKAKKSIVSSAEIEDSQIYQNKDNEKSEKYLEPIAQSSQEKNMDDFLKERNLTNEEANKKATAIQARFKGYRIRKKLQGLKNDA